MNGMSELQLGMEAPDFMLPDGVGNLVTLHKLRGQKVVVYFYPKDNTAGCASEARDFSLYHGAFAAAGAVIIGISRDSVRSHSAFSEKLGGLPFSLLSDGDTAVCEAYGVLKEKKMYGKTVVGIERSTFVLDREGIIRGQYRKVKTAGHAALVLEAVRALP